MGLAKPGGTWVIDLDGVVWLAQRPIPGSADAVERLRASGVRVLFATNNASPTIGELLESLSRAGIPAQPADLVTSAQAAAAMVYPGDAIVVCGGAGAVEALTERGARVVAEGPADVVVVGLTREFDFKMLTVASSAIRSGARFIGTNEDATYPTPEGLLPGAGSILAAVAAAAQATPEVAGKPHDPFVALLRSRAPDLSVMVGDRPSTDGELARRLGVPFALVRSGVTKGGTEPIVVEPDVQAADLGELVSSILLQGA